MGRYICILVFALPLVSCGHKYTVPEANLAAPPISRSATVYVATPADGQDQRPRTYAGSGDWAAAAIAVALRGRGATVVIGAPAERPSEAMQAAGAANADFLVYPHVNHWEDHLVGWSSIPDRITLDLSIYSLETGEVLDQQRIRASSRWLTFGGNQPQDLLPELTRRWAQTVVE